MKKILPLFFAFIITLNSIGLFVFYWGEIGMCKMEAFKNGAYKFHSKNIVVFDKDNTQFKIVNKHEIFSDGKMYDIIETENHDGKFIYFAISDKKEDRAANKISQLTEDNSDSKPAPFKSITHFVLKYIPSNRNFVFAMPQGYFKIEETAYSFYYQSPFGRVFSPPPEEFIS